ncbi:MAG: HYR domain-containing protein [Bacteroidales bacterium]|nr:HYR domain-containing protein [Bacteroidales bacterium]
MGSTIDFVYNSGTWEGENTYEIVVDGITLFSDGPNPVTGPVFSYTNPIVPPTTFPVGTTSVTWTVFDGELSTSCVQQITVVDNEIPLISYCPYPTGIVSTVNPGTCVATLNLTEVPLAGDNCGVASIVNDFNGTSNASGDYPVGPTVVTWTITDVNGNTNTCQTHVLVSDNISPTVITQNIDAYLNAQGVVSVTPDQIDNGSFDNCSIINMTLSQNVFSCTDRGPNTITLTVTDINNNQSSANADVNVFDTISPTISCPVNIIAPANSGCTAIGLNIGTPIYNDNCFAIISNDAPVAFPVGNTTVTWTVTDASGNFATCTQLITITDGNSPTITCPANIVTVTNTGCTATGVVLGTPVTADNCSALPATNNAPAAFPIGTTTVVWTVTDAAGNSATCEQLVTVNDTLKPTIVCPPTVIASTNTGCTATGVALGTPVTADNCGVESVSNDAPGVYPLGNTIVTWTVKDNAGNTATCTQLVTVVDDIDPIVHCAPAIVRETNTGCTLTGLVLDIPLVTENCNITSLTNDAPSAFPLGNTTVTWTAVDGSGNIGTCTQLVTVIDATNPTITCPADIVTFTNTGCTATGVALGTPVTADNCGVDTVTNNAPLAFPLGTTIVTWTVTDNTGNTATCEQLVTVNDTLKPTIVCPPTVIVSTNTGCTATGVALGTPVTADNCGVESVTNDAPGVYPLGNTIVTWTVKDNAGNTATCTQLVTVVDDIDPIVHCAPAIVRETNTGCTLTGLVLDIPLVTENCNITSLTNDAPSAFPLGNTTVTWTAVDGSGNIGICTQLVTVIDATNPTITCPADIVTFTNTGCTATGVALGTPVTADNCGVDTVTNNAPLAFPLGTTIVTWTVTDNTGNTATCEQLVTVNDTLKPTIVCPPTVIASTNTGCTATGVALGTPVTADNCGVESVSNDAPGVYPLGNTIVTWTVKDNAGNTATCTQLVTVVDDIDPIVHCAPAIVRETNTGCTLTGLVLDIPLVTENCNITSLTNDAPSAFPLGNTTVTWTAVDGSGNIGTCTQLVTVIDATNPTITCPADIVTFTNTGCTATGVVLGTPVTADNCGVGTVTNNAPLAFPLGTTIVTWTVTDNTGNTATCEQLVTVNDNVSPTITCPPAKTVFANTGCTATGVDLGTPVTADNCGVTSVINNAPGIYPLGNTTVTWTVIDNSGNITTCTQVVTVVDSVVPVIHCAPAIVVPTNTACTVTGLVLDIPLVTENCTVASLTNNAPSVYPLGNTTVTWTVTDGSGNSATCSQLVTVIDNVNPIITCPANVVAPTNNGCTATGVALGTPVTSDNCGVASVTNNAPAVYPLGITTVTWIVTDNAGLTATCDQLVTVIDTTPPVILCPVGLTLNTVPGGCDVTGVSIGFPTYTDNCSVGMGITNDAPVIYPIGTTDIIWTVADASGNTSTCVQTVFVGCTPLAVNDSVTTPENTPIIIDVLANDIDCGNNINPASVTIVSVPVNGTVVVNSDGTITYTPDYLFVGTNQFDYQVCDSLGLCDIGTVYITVIPVNNPVLGIAKALSRIEKLENGTFNLTYVITAENLGNDVITNIQVTDNLDETFPLPTLYTVLSVPYTNGTLTPNSLFNGSSDVNLLDSSASYLSIGASATIEFTVNVAIYGYEAQVFYNYAVGMGMGSLGTISADTSNNGYISDPNDNLDPGDNSEITPVTLTPEDIFIPNGFSPDGDNINDFFVITGIEDFPDSKLSIFNRWGNLIYTTTAYQNDWDGKPNSGAIVIGDKPVPQGTYFYIIEYNKDNRAPVSGYIIVQY